LPGTISGQSDLLARLGKHKEGKGCLYIKRLSDVDMAVLEEMVRASIGYMAEIYPD
jgi:predicted GIY-YIG superfamily endonuclease